MSMTNADKIREYYCKYVNPYLGELLTKIRLDKVFITGNGAYLFDDQGDAYLDFLSNYGASVLGHNYPLFMSAMHNFLTYNEVTFVQPSMGTEAAELARKLVDLSPESLRKVIFTNSGAESLELCIKVARAATGRQHVLTARNSFHGKTISALSATGQSSYQEPYHLPLPGYRYVPFGDLEALEKVLETNGEALAAFIIELIQGEGGVVQADATYFQAAQELCQHYGVKFIVDEVQTGIGRAGHIFYSNHLNLQPDAIALAKGLGGGMLPIGAVLLSDEMYSEDVGLTHSSTFAGNGMACRIGNVVIDELCANEQAILRQARETGAYLKKGLNHLKLKYPTIIKAVKGDGLMLGIEFDVNLDTYKGDWGSMLLLAANSGLLLPVMSGYLANVHKIRVAPTLNSQSTLRVQPPLIVTHEQCDTFCEALDETIAHLSQGNTYGLVQYLLTSKDNTQRIVQKDIPHVVPTPPKEEEGRFGFLIHPLTLQSYEHFDPSLSGISPRDMREFTDIFEGELDPAIVGSTRVTAKNGTTIYGEFAAIPYLPEKLMAMSQEEVLEYIRKAVIMLKERGAKIVGLGGYTSIVSKGGTHLSKLGVAVTTGNNYTVLSAIQAVNMAIAEFSSKTWDDIHVAVVGAGGSVGSTITREIALSVNRITLIGNAKNIEKTRRRVSEVLVDLSELLCCDDEFCANLKPNSVAERLKNHLSALGDYDQEKIVSFINEICSGEHSDIGIVWGTDTEILLPQADVTFVATNSTDILIHPHYLKRNAIVCDLSRPSNVNHIISLHRPDVFFIDGGVIQTPQLDDLGVNFGFPKGLCLACMAETMMLAFDRRYENTSLGARLKYQDQAYFRRKAEEYGFGIAGFRSFDLPLSDAAMERIRNARAQSPTDKNYSLAFENYRNINKFLLEQHASTETSAIAFHGDTCVSYDEAYKQISRYAAAYTQLGCTKGDRIAVLAEGGIESIFAIFACFHIGAVAVVLNPRWHDNEISTILAQSSLKLIVDEGMRTSASNAKTISLDVLSVIANQANDGLHAISVSSDAPAVIFCTPGSTGTHKQVCHSHGDVFDTFKNYGQGVLGISEQDRLFCTAKSYFIYSFKCMILGLAGGGGVILPPSHATPEEVERLSRTFKPTYVFSVPTIYSRMLQAAIAPSAFASTKYFISAGEPLPQDVYDQWSERYNKKILDGIGTTESLCFVISNFPEDINPGSAGKPVPGYQLKLINASGEEVRSGELGILWIKGNTVVSQYVDVDPQEYTDCFEDGWFKTNDVFYKNDVGWYYFQGRANDMVKVGGEWVSPRLLEEALNSHPHVKRSAVAIFNQIGLLNRPIAYVIPRHDDTDRDELVAELKNYCRDKLTRNQYPHVIKVVKQLPKSLQELSELYIHCPLNQKQTRGYSKLSVCK